MSNKYRLFVTLYDRLATRGNPFHFGLLLEPKHAPKSESTADVNFARSFDIPNAPDAKYAAEDGDIFWRYTRKDVDPRKSNRLVAKFLVAKLPLDKDLDEWASIMDSVLVNVPLVQRDPEFNCIVWTQQAMVALADLGGPFNTNPRLFPIGTGNLELEMLEVAGAGHTKLVATGRKIEALERDFRKRVDSPR